MPEPVHAVEAEPLRFGAFFQGPNGGTVSVLPDGTRTVTGDVVAAGMGHLFGPAVFDVEGPPGTIVSILTGSDVQLRGSNGGIMTLRIGNSIPSAPFVIGADPAARASVSIGGTLVAGPQGANPSGNYQGTFNIIFIEQ